MSGWADGNSVVRVGSLGPVGPVVPIGSVGLVGPIRPVGWAGLARDGGLLVRGGWIGVILSHDLEVTIFGGICERRVKAKSFSSKTTCLDVKMVLVLGSRHRYALWLGEKPKKTHGFDFGQAYVMYKV